MALQFCVVCGRGSTRSVWNNTLGSFVACDFHTVDEINYAVTLATTPAPNVTINDPALDESVES